MKSIIFNIKNAKALIIIVIFMQLVMQFAKISLENKKTDFTMNIEYKNYLNLFLMNTYKTNLYGGFYEEIELINAEILLNEIKKKFNIEKNKIKFKKPNTYKWSSNVKIENEGQIEKFVQSLQLTTKLGMTNYLNNKIEVFNQMLINDKFAENSDHYKDFLAKKFILENLLNFIKNDDNFLPFQKINIIKSKKEILLIENFIVTVLGTVFLMVLFINRRKIFSL